MLGWLTIVVLVLLANVFLAVAMNGAGRAFTEWSAAYSRRRLRRTSASPTS